MLGLNTITLISSRVGSFIKRIVTDGLKMRLPFTSAIPLGVNVVTDGSFNDTSEWVKENGWVVYGGLATRTDVDSFTALQQNCLVSGTTYIVTIVVDSVTSGNIFGIRLGTNYILQGGLSVGTHTATGTANGSVLSIMGNTDFAGTISSITIQEYAQETPDVSNNGNDAILKTGKCLVFDGSNDGIDISNFSMAGSEGTFAFWCKPDVSGTTDYIIDLAESADGRFLIAVDTNKFRVFTQTGGSGGDWIYAPNNSITFNEWQRVVVTIDSSRNLKFYKNGVQLGSTLTSNAVLNIDNVVKAFIGRNHSSVAAVFDGCLSDFQIYNKVWSDVDVAYDYANPQSLVTDNLSSDIHLTNLKAWWHMSEGSGTIAFDSAPLIGKELVVNGDFATDSDWITGTGISISNNAMNFTSQNGQYGSQPINIKDGVAYKINFEITTQTSGQLTIFLGAGNNVGLVGGLGKQEIIALADTSIDKRIYFGDVFSGSIDNISVKEVFNIDGETYDGSSLGATYDNAQERIPQLGMMNWSKGSNLIEYSEDFSSVYWSKGSVTLDSGYLAPDGTLSAYKVTANESYANAYRLLSGVGSYYRSIWAKTTSGTGTVSLMTRFDSTGSIFTITNEWQRFTINSADSLPDYFYAVDFRAGNLDEVILWGAQLENSDSASAYRRTNGTAVTDATLISCATDSQKDVLSNDVESRNSSLNLDGTGYAEVLDDNDFDIPACNNVDEGGFTLEAWVKAKYVYKGSGINVASTLGGNVTQPATGGIVSFSTNKLGAYINAAQLQADNTFVVGNWYYVVTKRSVNGNCKLYIDSIEQSDIDYTTGTITNSNVKQIGRDDGSVRYYGELIDDVKFYNRELSSDEIEQNYNATKSAHTN